LLTGGAQDLPERQQTLRNTLDWSFGLLSPAAQALLARLGVFADSFGLPAVEAVSGEPAAADPDRAAPVIDTLGSLVDNSLVWPETRGGQPRFRLLDTIREYALDRLRDGGDWTETHDRHAAYYLALAEPAEPELHDPGQLAWLDRLETEHDNLVAATSWSIDRDQLEAALRLVWVTWRFWWFHGHDGELARFSETILAKSDHLAPHQRARALLGAGFSLISGGDPARGQSLMEQSLSLSRQAGDHLVAGLAEATLGHRLALRHDYARATELLEDSLALLRNAENDELAGYERVQHTQAVAQAYNYLGQARLSKGDPGAAAQLFTKGLTAARQAPDRMPILISLYDLALSSQALGDLTGAAEHLTEGLSLAAEAEDQTSAAYYLEALAAMASLEGNPQRAVRLLAAADALLEAKGSGWLHAFVPRAPHDDDDLAALRSRTGDAAFEEAWAHGRSLPGRHAVEYALHHEPPGLARHRARTPLRALASGLWHRNAATATTAPRPRPQ